MHKIVFRNYQNSTLFPVRWSNFSPTLRSQRRRSSKVCWQLADVKGANGCLMLFLPGPSVLNHSSLSYYNNQHYNLKCYRFLQLSASRHNEETPTGTASKMSQSTNEAAKIRGRSGAKDERKKIDFSKIYTERNFISPVRAMNEYLLKPSDLEGLRKIQRRSPYEDNPPISVYLRRDVELKALEVWGSQEALQRELKKRLEEDKKYRDSIFRVKKILKEYSRSTMHEEEKKRQEMILRTSGRVVMTAVIINATNFALKFAAWIFTGSHSMFAEAIHSFADTCNQLLLSYGIRKSLQTPTAYHPYGYHNMRYVASLISGVGIFFLGTGLSIYHGIMGILNPEVMDSLLWAYVILAGSLVSEGGTLMVAFKEIRRGANRDGMSFMQYVVRSQDPSVNVVLLEDVAAVLGIAIAGTCIGLTSYTGSPIYDSIGSLLVGGVLGAVASFIIYTNTGALVGRSIPAEQLQLINKEMENDVMIRAIHDVKATDMGNNFVRYKAEVDFDGRELTRSYMDSQDLEALLEEMQKMKSIEEVEAFLLKHGENIVDLLGGQIDRIEITLKKRHPGIRHVDLEVL